MSDIIRKQKSGMMKRKIQRRRRVSTDSTSTCFACQFSRSKLVISHTNEMLDIIKQNYGKMSMIQLAKIVHLYYKHKIYTPNKGELPIWRTASVLQHLEDHTDDPVIFVLSSIRKFKRLEKCIQQSTFREVKIGNKSVLMPDERAIKTMISVNKRIETLYKSKLQTLAFYDGESSIDMNSVNKLININKYFVMDGKKPKQHH